MRAKIIHLVQVAVVPGLLLTTSAVAKTLRVPADHPTIGAALAAARNGDRIIVADGVYSGPGNRDLDFEGKIIRLTSENGPENCIIDCQGTVAEPHRGFYFHRGEPPAATLEGFTIQHGVSVENGGAILCEASSPTIRNCVFRWNEWRAVGTPFQQGGGALSALNGSRPRLIDCTFVENVAEPAESTGAGAVSIAGSNARLVRCAFVRNTAREGGAVVVAAGSRAQFQDCVFEANVGTHGGGGLMGIFDAHLTIQRCKLLGNVGGEGGGGGLALVFGSIAAVDNSFFGGNSGSGDGGAIVVGGDSDLIVSNSTIVGNDAPFYIDHAIGGGICAWGSRVTVINSVVYGNTAIDGPAFGLILPFSDSPPMTLTVSRSLVQDGQSGVFIQDPSDPNFVVNWSVDNFDADPLFVDPLGPDGLPATGDEDLHLLPGSPCIDAGNPAYASRPAEVDIDGDPRVLDGDGDGIAVIDIGADEFAAP